MYRRYYQGHCRHCERTVQFSMKPDTPRNFDKRVWVRCHDCERIAYCDLVNSEGEVLA